MALDWKVISQRNWIKGLQATFSRFAQTQGILVRLSNLLYDFRGGLRTSDGSLIFAQQNVGAANQGRILEISLYSPTGQQPYYVDIQSTINAGLAVYPAVTLANRTVGGAIANVALSGTVATVTFTAAHNLISNGEGNGQLIQSGSSNPAVNATIPFSAITVLSPTSYSYPLVSAATSATGGSMRTGFAPLATVTYYVTAVDGQGGETPTPNNATSTLSSGQNAMLVTWTAVPNATGYNVYGRTAGTSILRLNSVPVQSPWLDLGGAAVGGPIPTQNTAQQVTVQSLQPPTGSTVLGTFPTYYAPPLGSIPGASGKAANPATGLASPSGGIIGQTGPLPQVVQFANKLIFAMGNGYAPQEYADDGKGGTTGALTPVGNTFNATNPDWQASVAWNAGDTIKDSVSGGIFVAQQGGTSGATRPAFNNTLGAITAEVSPGTVTWKDTAVSSTGTPLRGAAQMIVYAGSLWIADTWPVTTADELDGPNCLKMSDANNPESWNPVNVAFLNKDDGDRIAGLATFTIAESGISPTGSLVIFKNFSTFQLTGVFGATDLTIQQAQTDLGCIAPRSINFIPGFGIMRLAHLGFAYFNGVNDKLASEEIRPYLFGGKEDIQPLDWNFAYFSKAAQAANPPMYLCACPILAPVLAGVTITGNGGTLTLYVRVIQQTLSPWGNWENTASTPETMVAYTGTPAVNVITPGYAAGIQYVISAGESANAENVLLVGASFNGTYPLSTFTAGLTAYASGGLQRLFAYDLVMKQWTVIDLPFEISVLKQVRSPGTVPITVACGASDGSTRRFFSGDLDWDNGDEVEWTLRSAELFQQGGSAKVFYRRLVIRGSGNIGQQVTITFALQGTSLPPTTAKVYKLGGTQWELRVDINKDAANANATLSGFGPAQIILESMDWYVKPKASGAPTSIQK